MLEFVLSLIPSALAADSASVNTSVDVNWSAIGPFLIFVLGNICILAYMFGVTNQRIRVIDNDLERVRVDVERIREQNRDTDKRMHEMHVVLSKIDTRLEVFLTAASETGVCPLFKATLANRRNEADALLMDTHHDK